MTQMRILIVEDELITAMDIQQRLTTLGYQVVGRAASGETAIGKAGELRPDLVLMDIHLKGEMDGIEAARQIRDQYPIPVVYLTAFSDSATLERAKVTEAYGYIIKPFEERELVINIEIARYKHQMEQQLRNSQARLKAIFDSAFDGLFLINAQGSFVEANPAACTMTGYGCEELLAGEYRMLLFSEETACLDAHGVPLKQPGATCEQRLRRKDGSEMWAEIAFLPLALGGEEYTLATVRDITDRRHAEAALHASEERYMLAAQGANDGLWDWDLIQDTVYYSPRWKAILGCTNGEIGNRPDDWLERVHPDDQFRLRMSFGDHLKGRSEHFECEHRIRHRDGSYRWVLTRGLAVRKPDGLAYRISGSQTDITDRKRAEEQLQHDAFHDTLTGLPNRALLLDRLSQAIERSNRQDAYAFGLLFLDLDQFKVINDSLGHTTGDELLAALARRLEGCIRTMDTLARLGGDEFVIMLDGLESAGDAVLVAERIHASLHAPFELGSQSIYTSASIGVVFSARGYERTEDVLRDADIAMYRAKSLGKNRFVVFESCLLEKAIVRLEMENDLRRAIERQEFELYYQPIFSLAGDTVSGFEALIRWRHPRHGFIPPAGFIPVAEETGLILPIGGWVLHEACRQMRAWQARYPVADNLYVSVNISARQLTHPGFLQQLTQALNDTGLSADSLRIEITESILMENNGVCEATLQALSGQGVQIFIDDFGTGYSSLSYIQRFPASTIKVDRSFINQIDGEDQNSELLQSILRFAVDLNLQAIAEGVESSQQLARLKSLVCPYGQGFYLSKPLDAAAAEVLLSGATIEGRNQQ